MNMDLVSLHVVSSMLSVVAQMSATIVVLFCVVNFFSLKTGKSVRIVFVSLFYFFFSVIILFAAALFLKDISPYHMLIGVSALMEASLIHLCYGILVLSLYMRSFIS